MSRARGKPLAGAGGAELPEPVERVLDDAVAEVVRDATGATTSERRPARSASA